MTNTDKVIVFSVGYSYLLTNLTFVFTVNIVISKLMFVMEYKNIGSSEI